MTRAELEEWGFHRAEGYAGVEVWCLTKSATLVAFYDEGAHGIIPDAEDMTPDELAETIMRDMDDVT